MVNSKKQTYTLKEAAERVGVAPITLKRWFLAEKLPDVARDRNGWRVFTPRDIRRIREYVSQANSKNGRVADSPAQTDDRPSVVSFFSGIGGLDLGFERAGFDITFQCEIDDYCRAILRQHWPKINCHKDIREVSNADVPLSDVWMGGFPCQDVSLASMGKRKGLRGKQSGLFFEFARLVGEGRPSVVVIENVPGLLSSHGGRDFEIVIRTLAELGYVVGWRTLNSRYFGAPQSRQRVFIVGCYRNRGGPGAILFEPERRERHAAKGRSHGKKSPSPFKRIVGEAGGEGPVIQSIAYCLYACSARHTGTDWSRNYVCYPKQGRVRRLTPKECEGVMGIPDGWTIPPPESYSENDLDSKRYYALGNAVTPPVAEWLAQRIYAYLKEVAAGGYSVEPQMSVASG